MCVGPRSCEMRMQRKGLWGCSMRCGESLNKFDEGEISNSLWLDSSWDLNGDRNSVVHDARFKLVRVSWKRVSVGRPRSCLGQR